MQKLDQLYKLLFLILISISLSSCKDERELKTPLAPAGGVTYSDPVNYLNHIRTTSGLNLLSKNSILSTSALNHAKYSYENEAESHDEIEGKPYFTGKNPNERAFYAEYNSFITENLSTNNTDAINSIDGLMSAIYHRFGFLDPKIDEIGWGSYGDDSGKNFVYNMGNSKLESFCKEGVSDNGYGKFYSGVCKDDKISISDIKLNTFQRLNRAPFILYPNSKNTKAFFSRETPDPMPECKITANPISIEFNSFESPVAFVSFKVFEGDKWLMNSKILTSLNDPNSLLNEFQFALFIKEPFKFNQTYKAEFRYIQRGEPKVVEWEFTTSTPTNPYFVVNDGDNLALKPDVWYDVFINPAHCNDVSNTYNFSFNPLQKPEIKSIDTNLLRVKLSGLKGFDTVITTDNGKKITLVLTESSDGAFDNKFIFVFIFVIMLAIYFIIKR
ncbi:MAG: CAP domain-containing protein [Campylobacteraceae bacterium]|nr:CAP domain-containing protein [Campylobacteraceae bacterium]